MRTIIFKIDPKKPDKLVLDYAAAAIRLGRLVGFPTETVYGIAANRLDKKAINDLSKAKNRPGQKPFTVHISDLGMIRKMKCRLTKEAKALTGKFWPGPLTVILKSGRGEKIGFRMPANKVALGLIAEARVPIVAPSANISGKRPPTDVMQVLKTLDGKIDLLLDAGPTDLGVESTVIDFTVRPPRILREGAISRGKITKALDK